MGESSNLCEKFIRENRDVGFLQTRRREDVYYRAGSHGTGHQLANRMVEVFIRSPSRPRRFRQSRPHSLEESHVIADAKGVGMGDSQSKGA
jgi:hypothetical protein